MRTLFKNIIHLVLDYLLIFLILGFALIAGWFYWTAPQENTPLAAYLIGYDERWYPLQFMDKEETITGFSNDLLQAIGEEQNISLELIASQNNNLLSGLDQGRYDGFLSSLNLYDADAAEYLSSEIYFHTGPVCIVSQTSSIKSLNDLKGKTIGILTGFYSRLPEEKFLSTNFIFYDYNNRFQMIEDVNKHVIDGMIMNRIPGSEFIKVYPNEFRILHPALTDEGLKLISKKNPEFESLIHRFNQGLNAIKKKGLYNQLLLKWNLSS
jgi:ABC-type amino acid transport substrate-binding protein